MTEMRNIVKKITFTLAVSVLALVAYGQQNFGEQWGETPAKQEENVRNYNFFRDAYNNKDYDEALELLPGLVEGSPKGHPNIYIYAINIYKDKILKSTSVAEKNGNVDELMKLYDLRVEHFGDDPERGKPYILSFKADDYATYKPVDRDNVLQYYRDALEAYGDNAPTDLMIRYFNELTNDYKGDLIESDEYMAEYDTLERLFNLPQNSDKSQDKTTFEALFIQSGAANCENIEKMFASRIDDGDAALLERVVGLLARGKCDTDFFGVVGDKLYAMQPTGPLAMHLADYYDRKGQADKSLQYLNAAIENETDPEVRVNLAARIAGSKLAEGDARGAADFARQALSIDPNNGLGYFFLAQAYAVGTGQCSGFERQAAFWLVYDTLAKAKSLMTGDDSYSGEIDTQLASYRRNFPTQEECFFQGYTSPGAGYTVRCGWVSGSTTVRYR